MGKDATSYLVETVLARPYGFVAGGEHFYLFPVTLGKTYILADVLDSIGIDQSMITKNLAYESLRIATEKREQCLMMIAYYTCRTADELFNAEFFDKRYKKLDEALTQEDVATLIVTILTLDKSSLLMSEFGINEEQDRLSAVNKVKMRSGNTMSFGGKTVFGNLIDVACERYGWTKEYVVWGIDLASLKVMLADKLASVYLSDDEMKNLPAWIRNTNDEVIEPTKENMERILSMNWK